MSVIMFKNFSNSCMIHFFSLCTHTQSQAHVTNKAWQQDKDKSLINYL